MILTLSLSLLAQEERTDLVSLALRYLARHQAEDGSWGRRAAGCSCPAEPGPPAVPLDAPGRERVARLLADLDAEDTERRLRAQRELVGLGEAAEPPLREAAGSPERRARAADVLREIRRAGTREDLELTAWALLSFMGAGFSPLSKDIHDGRDFGRVVREGLAWILSKEDGKGAFAPEDASAQAVAALAVCEAYGLMGTEIFQGPAQRAIDLLDSPPSKDARTLTWQIMALKSAEIGGLAFPASAYASRLKEMNRRRSEEPASLFLQAAHTMATIFIEKSKKGVDLGDLAGADPARMDIEAAYLAALALFQADGPSGKTWKAYREVQARWIVPSQVVKRESCARGAWTAAGTAARIKLACRGALINEMYYAYTLPEK